MTENMFLVLIFFMALLLSIFLTPFIRKIASKLDLVDRPDPRKMHKTPIPYGGGIVIYLSFFLTTLIMLYIYDLIVANSQQIATERNMRILFSIFIGGTLTFLLGMVDDIIVMQPKLKLLGQVFIVLITYFSGVAITFVTNPFDGSIFYFPRWLSILLTVLWIVGIMNALNLLDGLDGLLAGVSTISALVFLEVSLLKGQLFIAMLMAILAGSTLGFLKYNFNPAQIFMGDAGSLFLGIIFASISVIGALKSTTTVAFFIPVLIIGLPIIDTLWAIIRRALKRQPIFKADKEHIHHKLISFGLSVRQVVLIIYIINIFFGLIGLVLSQRVW